MPACTCLRTRAGEKVSPSRETKGKATIADWTKGGLTRGNNRGKPDGPRKIPRRYYASLARSHIASGRIMATSCRERDIQPEMELHRAETETEVAISSDRSRRDWLIIQIRSYLRFQFALSSAIKKKLRVREKKRQGKGRGGE